MKHRAAGLTDHPYRYQKIVLEQDAESQMLPTKVECPALQQKLLKYACDTSIVNCFIKVKSIFLVLNSDQ